MQFSDLWYFRTLHLESYSSKKQAFTNTKLGTRSAKGLYYWRKSPPTSGNLYVRHKRVRLYLSSEYTLLTLLHILKLPCKSISWNSEWLQDFECLKSRIQFGHFGPTAQLGFWVTKIQSQSAFKVLGSWNSVGHFGPVVPFETQSGWNPGFVGHSSPVVDFWFIFFFFHI